MRTRSPLPPLLLTLLAAAAPAQIDNSVTATVVVHFAASETPPNTLVTPILREAAVEAAVRKILGDRLTAYGGIGTDVQPEAAGRCQVQFTVNLAGNEPWPAATREAIVDAAFTHLRTRLAELLHDEPLRLLAERRARLLDEREQQLREHAALQARWDAIDAQVSFCQARRAELHQQRLAVQIDVATERLAQEFLERRCADLVKLRDARRDRKQEIALARPKDEPDRQLLELRLAKLASAPPQKEQAAEIEQLREHLRALNAQFAAHSRDLDRANEELADTQDQLARCLEQLPASALALQRAQARLDALDAIQQEIDKRAADAAQQREAAIQQLARAEQLRLDLEVGRSVLAEVQGRLARLEPVRCSLLR